MRRSLVLMIFGLTMIAADAHAQCMQAGTAGEIQEGRLVQQTAEGNRIFVLRIPAPVCLRGLGGTIEVRATRAIRIYSSSARVEKDIHRFVGKDVHVVGVARRIVHYRMSVEMDLSDIDQI